MAAKVAGILLASLAVTLAPWSVGQTSGKPTQSKSTPDSSVFKSSSRLVLVDAVVTDSNGQPVHGLRSGDFTVLEDGKPQKVVSFEEERSDSDKKAPAPALNLPPNVYTNYVTRGDPGALTVLLFDSLNTDRQTLTFAKTEMVNFLKKLPPGKKVALYTLGSQLRMVQGFTDNSDTLIAAAKQLSNKTHPVYTNSRELSEQIGM